MMNDTIMKYDDKEKHHIYVETLMEKNHGQKIKFHYEFEKFTEYNRIENKP